MDNQQNENIIQDFLILIFEHNNSIYFHDKIQ